MHPKYLEQVLRDRGIPHPPFAQLEMFVASMSEAEVPAMEERLRKLAFGTETQEDLDELLDGIRAAVAVPARRQEASSLAPPLRDQETRSQAAPASARPATSGGEKLPADVLATLRQHGMHVYAKSAALKIELATLRAGEATGNVVYTVQIDAARARGEGYDWQAKVPFQFTRRELPLLTAFLLGMSGQKLTLSNHGPNTDKHLEVEDQGANLFVKVRITGRAPVALPVMAPDVFAWGELCLVALHLNRPTLGTDAHLALLRRMSRMEAPRD